MRSGTGKVGAALFICLTGLETALLLPKENRTSDISSVSWSRLKILWEKLIPGEKKRNGISKPGPTASGKREAGKTVELHFSREQLIGFIF